MFFTEIADSADPGRQELEQFVIETERFLKCVVESNDHFAFLWGDNRALQSLAIESFRSDVAPSVNALIRQISGLDDNLVALHGLAGRALRFKVEVLRSVAQQWEDVSRNFTVRGWFKQICDAIDAILDSLIQAAGGIGGLIKEFKDSLSALVKVA